MESERRTNIIGAELDDSRLSDILSASQIKVTDSYETPPQIIWIDNSTIATLGNFSASTGKAKSKKTFNVSAIVAASLAGKQVLNYRAHLPEGKQRILYVDTEQSRFHCHNVLERILKLAGLPDTTDNDRLDFICLREYSPAIRIEVIDYALRRGKGYGLVVIDGIRDLMLDINSTSESVEVINKMMEWSSKYNLHIHCVLHLNKGGQQRARAYRNGDEQQGGNGAGHQQGQRESRRQRSARPPYQGKGVQAVRLHDRRSRAARHCGRPFRM